MQWHVTESEPGEWSLVEDNGSNETFHTDTLDKFNSQAEARYWQIKLRAARNEYDASEQRLSIMRKLAAL